MIHVLVIKMYFSTFNNNFEVNIQHFTNKKLLLNKFVTSWNVWDRHSHISLPAFYFSKINLSYLLKKNYMHITCKIRNLHSIFWTEQRISPWLLGTYLLPLRTSYSSPNLPSPVSGISRWSGSFPELTHRKLKEWFF